MFKNLFEIKKKVKPVRLGLEVTKLEKVTKINFPDNNITLTKEDRVILASLDTGEILLAKVAPDIPEAIAKKTFSYNITDNSVNSQVLANKLREIFEIDEESFTLNTEIVMVQGVQCLVISNNTEEVQEASDPSPEVTGQEAPEILTEDLEDIV